MAFGFSPKNIQDISIDALTQGQFLVLLVEASKKLDWNISYTSETGFIAYTKFSMSPYGEQVTVKIDGENANLKSECTGNQLIDWGKNKKNIDNLINTFDEIKSGYTFEELDQKYAALKVNFAPAVNDMSAKPPLTTGTQFGRFIGFFKPSPGYFITPVLIDINILIFTLMVLSGVNFMVPDNESMLAWGADFGPSTLNGEWWRIFTNCFLHFGILHLAMNMYALIYIGLLLEPYLGKARFASAYVLTGIAASLTSLCWHSQTLSAGASGAIFGMYGVFLAMLTTNFIEKSARKALLTSIGIFVVFNLMNGVKSGIDNAAHIGGLVSGLLIGYVYIVSLKKPDAVQLKYASIAGLTACMILSSFVLYKKIPNDLGIYEKRIKQFSDLEKKALVIYDMHKDATKEQALEEIKDHGLYYWKENIRIINDADKLNVQDALHAKDKLLVRYCQLRIQSYTLLYKALNENTDSYKDSLQAYNANIRSLIDSLKNN